MDLTRGIEALAAAVATAEAIVPVGARTQWDVGNPPAASTDIRAPGGVGLDRVALLERLAVLGVGEGRLALLLHLDVVGGDLEVGERVGRPGRRRHHRQDAGDERADDQQ